ncbi:hypothetical protein Acr_20g0009610 [Actinidia rufa]|uniref:UBN2_3 domain-containing protein n=1 Tax=Actinidia rufa TaxID=165716 RepID=A0A7J0GEC3_9ERIC|nr:hypothetical protein Acr_20g0009610 [Actinidia rufa]
MQRFLRAQKFWKYIIGDAQPPHLPEDVDDASYAKYQSQLEHWDRDNDNSKIITWFAKTSIPSIHSLFTPFETAKEVWDYLDKRYSLVDSANEYQLGLELHHLRFEPGQTLTDFYNKMSSLWNYLAQFEPTWTYSTDAAAFYAYRDRSRLRHFHMDLPSDYEHTRASLLHRHPLPTIGQALAELRSEKTRKKTMASHQHSQPVLATPSWSPLPSSSQPVRTNGSKTIPSGSQKKYCTFCRRDNHSYEKCRSRNKPRHKGYHGRAQVLKTFATHTRVSLLHLHPLPTLGQALAKLRSEQTRKKTMTYHQHSQPVLATPSWAPLPLSSQPVQSTSTGSKTMPSSSQKKYCNFCRHDNHSYEDCRSHNKPRRKGSYYR